MYIYVYIYLYRYVYNVYIYICIICICIYIYNIDRFIYNITHAYNNSKYNDAKNNLTI